MKSAELYVAEYNSLAKEIRILKRSLNSDLDYEKVLEVEAVIIQKQTRKERVSQILADEFGMFRG